MTLLKISNDRKTTQMANAAGTMPAFGNAFGLPSGVAYSCPGATAVCEQVCYAGRSEKAYTSVRKLVEHNFDLLKDASFDQMVWLLAEMMDRFTATCTKRGAAKIFRIHWDGDFFSLEYAKAWATVIKYNPDVQFWAYTRSFVPALNVVPTLTGIDNLSLYLSADSENMEHAVAVQQEFGTRLATLSEYTDDTKALLIGLTGRPGAACPENLKRIPLITKDGGACFSCGLCITGTADIRFSIKKKVNASD